MGCSNTVWLPITFTIKTLIDIETCYVDIEQCALVWRSSTPSRHVMVQNDHKLLEMIQHKPIHVASLGFSRCFCTCRSMTTPSIISLEKKCVSQPLKLLPSCSNSLPIPIAQMSSMCSCLMLNWRLFETLWSTTWCIALSITSPFEVGPSAGSEPPDSQTLLGRSG